MLAVLVGDIECENRTGQDFGGLGGVETGREDARGGKGVVCWCWKGLLCRAGSCESGMCALWCWEG